MIKPKKISVIIGDNQRKNLNDEFISDKKTEVNILKKEIELEDGSKNDLYILKKEIELEDGSKNDLYIIKEGTRRINHG